MEHTDEKSQEVHFRILNAVTKLEVSKGHLGWKISDIAKEADVTRSLVYYYLGKDKQVILSEAVKFMLEKIFNLFEDEPVQVQYRIKIALQEIKRMPYLLVLFILNRKQDNFIGEIIRVGEERLFSLLQRLYPAMKPNDILKIYLLELGAAMYGDLTEAQVEEFFPE